MDEDMLRDLLRQAWLFEDPKAYEAGVRDAWDAVTSVLGTVARTGTT